MMIPDHVLKKYAQQVANKCLHRILSYDIPEEVWRILVETSGNDADLGTNLDRLIELLETAHVGLSWTKEN